MSDFVWAFVKIIITSIAAVGFVLGGIAIAAMTVWSIIHLIER